MLKEAFETVKNQMGPCGIACATCNMGNGTVAETAAKLRGFVGEYELASWAPSTPGGVDVDFANLGKALDWIQTYTRCLGCERGGGPPECPIRTCATGKGFALCADCPDLDRCGKFDWLGDAVGGLKENLRKGKGRSKKELIEEAMSKMEL